MFQIVDIDDNYVFLQAYATRRLARVAIDAWIFGGYPGNLAIQKMRSTTS